MHLSLKLILIIFEQNIEIFNLLIFFLNSLIFSLKIQNFYTSFTTFVPVVYIKIIFSMGHIVVQEGNLF